MSLRFTSTGEMSGAAAMMKCISLSAALFAVLVTATNAHGQQENSATTVRPRTVASSESASSQAAAPTTDAKAGDAGQAVGKPADKPAVTQADKANEKPAGTPAEKPSDKPTGTSAEKSAVKAADTLAKTDGSRREQPSEEEAAILPYYNNYLSSYRLGPEDVISVTVFGQERYSKAGIVIPPDGRISYPLIPDGLFVAGKTTRQVQDELVKQLDEYIIDPKISVALEKAVSARYSVLGDVAQPGIRTMNRRLSVYEAIAEAGGVLNTGDKSNVFVLRRQPDGTLRPIRVDIKQIERGQAKEMAYLVPGDQVVVPGNKLKKIQEVTNLFSLVSFARIFTGGVF
jgi:polysaccharide export outer membrane protein